MTFFYIENYDNYLKVDAGEGRGERGKEKNRELTRCRHQN
jgi:hypothetical protein